MRGEHGHTMYEKIQTNSRMCPQGVTQRLDNAFKKKDRWKVERNRNEMKQSQSE